MKLSQYLTADRVRVSSCATKEEAIDALLASFADCSEIADHAGLADAIREREEVLPTGIGLGIGVPHVHCKAVRDPVASLLVLREGVEYGSMDGEPVRLLLMIAMPEGMHNVYLSYLARVSNLLMQDQFRKAVLACADQDSLWALVREK